MHAPCSLHQCTERACSQVGSSYLSGVRIFSRNTLVAYWSTKGNADAEQPLRAWLREAEKAAWASPADIRARFNTASFVGRNVVFNIGGNNYRLICHVLYAPLCTVYIRFIGTHAEYEKIDAAKV
jgi:mRNA interferase HigB